MKAWGMESRRAGITPKLFEVEAPGVGPTSVLVEVKGSSVNPADLKVMSGKHGGRFLHANQFPLLLGYDFSGVVIRLGSEVTDFIVGQEVCGFLPYSTKTRQGAFSQYVAAGSMELAKKPRSITFAAAAALGTAASTALQALRDKGHLQPGQKVLINGASGGVGSLAVRIGKRLGAEVWGICSTKNLEYTKQLGADQTIDYNTNKIRDLSGKFDVIFDVASNSGFTQCARILSPRGIYISLFPTPAFIGGYVRSLFSAKSCRFLPVKSKRADLDLIAKWVDEECLRPCVDTLFPFSELPQALNLLSTHSSRGKIAISF